MNEPRQGRIAAICDALVASGGALSQVMRQVSDPTPRTVGVWSIGATAQHVARSTDYFLAAARGDADLERLEDVNAENARSLAEDPERDPRIMPTEPQMRGAM